MSKINLKDNRPKDYSYIDMVKDHLGGDLGQIFNGEIIYPRQMELHLPGDGINPCNFNCFYCQAQKLKKNLSRWEKDALRLIERLGGKIPWIILSGQYTEPLLNPYFLDFVEGIKRSGSIYGIHTNGSLLETVAEELCFHSTSPRDFVSCSLDAGSADSHTKTKNLKINMFDRIIDGLESLTRLRGNKYFPAIRVTYLMNKQNATPEEIKNVVAIMKKIKPDTLRFSIPYAHYGNSFAKVDHYRKSVELRYEEEYFDLVAPYLSKKPGKPFIFWLSPKHQDVRRLNFDQCITGYFSIVFGADGRVYKCSSATAPDFKACRLGKVTDDVEKFRKMIAKNQNPAWLPGACYAQGARCNRIMIEINDAWRDHA